jgi:pilus assembly protein CpaB
MLVGLAIAVVVGLLTARLVYKRLQQAAAEQPVVATSQIVVAAAPLPLGSRLRAKDLRLIAWPAGTALAGSFSRVEDCVDRALITAVVENEPILAAKLAPKEAGAGLPAVIPEGMRAVSVRVDDVVGVAGFVTPGTMVDVQVTADAGGGGGGVTNTILQDVRVLAAGQKVEQDKEGKPQTVSVVTLLVNPEQANKLTMASTDGRIHLALRNTIDTKLVEPPPVYMTSLLGARPQPAPKGKQKVKATAPPPPPPLVVEVIRGDKKDTATFPTH